MGQGESCVAGNITITDEQRQATPELQIATDGLCARERWKEKGYCVSRIEPIANGSYRVCSARRSSAKVRLAVGAVALTAIAAAALRAPASSASGESSPRAERLDRTTAKQHSVHRCGKQGEALTYEHVDNVTEKSRILLGNRCFEEGGVDRATGINPYRSTCDAYCNKMHFGATCVDPKYVVGSGNTNTDCEWYPRTTEKCVVHGDYVCFRCKPR